MVNSARLKKVLDYVDYADTVADIGADHGYLSEMLIESNKAKKVIATDISDKCLEKTKDLIKRRGLKEVVEPRVGNGLLVIGAGEISCAVIAGMGGYEIAKILGDKSRKDCTKNFVLQPVQNSVELREWLSANRYEILLDECVEEAGKFYDVLKVKKVFFKKKLNYAQKMFGKSNLERKPLSKDFIGKLQYEKSRLSKVLENNALTEERSDDVFKYIKMVNRLLRKNQ